MKNLVFTVMVAVLGTFVSYEFVLAFMAWREAWMNAGGLFLRALFSMKINDMEKAVAAGASVKFE